MKDALKKIGASLAFLLLLALAAGLASLLVRQFGLPDTLAAMLSAVGGVVILFFAFGALMAALRLSRRHTSRGMHDKLTYTLGEIGRGNFNVFIEIEPHTPHNEIAEAMNEMAKSLGTMETMRQDFISNVSHEIQSPLTSIGGFAKLLKESAPDEQSRHYAEIIEAESKRLSSLSDNLLKLSSLDNSKITLSRIDFRLDKQLEQIALTLEPQWSAKNLELSMELTKTTVNADADLLSQVWVNLLVNAIKFTPVGGSITVTLKDSTVTIADTGAGIAKDDQARIKERGIPPANVHTEKLSGKDTKRPELQRLMSRVRAGDTVKVESISRFARNTRDLLDLVEKLNAKGVEFVSLKENIDTTTPTGKFMLTVFGAVAELERGYILQRQREGIAAARARGVRFGRPLKEPPDNYAALVRLWERGKMTVPEVLERTGMKDATFYNRLREHRAR